MTIPPGLAVEVPAKPMDQQRRRGELRLESRSTADKVAASDDVDDDESETSPVRWVRHV